MTALLSGDPSTGMRRSPDTLPLSGDEPELVARARSGDVEAFEVLYRRTAGRVFAICLRMSGDRVRARELTLDLFVRAWEKLPSFRGEAAFSSWLHRMTVNHVLEAQRADRRRTARVMLAGDATDDEEADSFTGMVHPDPETRIDLERAIGRLPPNARAVFVLHEVEGYKHEEIARMMGTASGTVRAHLHRARQLLMEWLSR
ncbi:MAG: RNA polymerase sigma factor [Gemmatimonadaceae bacterium]